MDIIICTERGRLEDMAKALVMSIRNFSGILSDANIFSYSPRMDFLPEESTFGFLKDYGVEIIKSNINIAYKNYPLANKPIVCALHESNACSDNLLFLDSDSLFINQVHNSDLIGDADIQINPVDYPNIATDVHFKKGINTNYWLALYKLLNVNARRQVKTTVSGDKILEYYNSGFVYVKRNKGIFQKWNENFNSAYDAQVFPAKEMFFMEQSILSATIAQMNLNVQPLGSQFNYPIGTYSQKWRGHFPYSFKKVKHIHYHKIFNDMKINPIANKLGRLHHGSDINMLIDNCLINKKV